MSDIVIGGWSDTWRTDLGYASVRSPDIRPSPQTISYITHGQWQCGACALCWIRGRNRRHGAAAAGSWRSTGVLYVCLVDLLYCTESSLLGLRTCRSTAPGFSRSRARARVRVERPGPEISQLQSVLRIGRACIIMVLQISSQSATQWIVARARALYERRRPVQLVQRSPTASITTCSWLEDWKRRDLA